MIRLAGLFPGRVARIDLPRDVELVYALGDLHGDLDALDRAETRIAAEIAADGKGAARARLVLLGDMIDRGALTAHLLDRLCRPGPVARICLAGNHERMLLEILDGSGDPETWRALGGEATLVSYGLAPRPGASRREIAAALADIVPARHLELLRGLPVAARWGEWMFSHAGGDPGKTWEAQSEIDLVERRARPEDGVARPRHGLVSVHGHVPGREPEIRPWRICLDTGLAGAPSCLRVDVADSEKLRIFRV